MAAPSEIRAYVMHMIMTLDMRSYILAIGLLLNIVRRNDPPSNQHESMDSPSRAVIGIDDRST